MPPTRAGKPPEFHRRATSPLVGLVAVIAITISLATVLAVVLAAGPGTTTLAGTPDSTFELAVDSADDGVAVTHRSGDPIDVRRLTVHLTVDGKALANQPPVPFFAEDGFRGGPGGPFNERADPSWTAGETASFRLATTNDPSIDAGDEVVLTLAVDGTTIARLEATAA